MENKFDPIATQLQDLILQKDFEALTVAERDFVLEHITEEDYYIRKSVIESSEELFEEERLLLVPNPAIKARIKEKMQPEQEKKRTPFIVALFTYQIPAYQAGIAAIILLGLLIYRPENEVIKKVPETNTVYVDRIDTLYVEKEVPRVDTVTEYVVVPLQKSNHTASAPKQNNTQPTKVSSTPVNNSNTTAPVFTANHPTIDYSVDQLLEKSTQPKGNSFKDEKEITDVMVRVY